MELDDDVFSSTIIETLYLFCKLKLADTTDLQLLDNEDVQNISECIRMDNVHFVESTDPSVTWSAVIAQFENHPLLDVTRTNSATDDLVNELSENYKRIYGSLLCTAELLMEFCPRSGPVVVQSLYKSLVSPVLFGHSNSTSFILNIAQDYKMYFPYAYTFSRRIGRNPHMTLQQWRDCLFPELSRPSGSESNHQDMVADWDMSGLEEGEDSDGEDQKSLNDQRRPVRSPTRRRATRMNASRTTRRAPDSPARTSGAGADVLMQTISSEDSLLEIQDLSFVSGKEEQNVSRNSKDGARQSGKSSPTRAANSSSASRFTDALAGAVSSSENEDDLTIEDLRTIFDQSLEEGSDLAEKRKLARNLEYNLDLPALANSVRRFHDIELSWDEIKDLAEPYIVKKKPIREKNSSGSHPHVAPSQWGDAHRSRENSSPNELDDIPDISDYNDVAPKSESARQPQQQQHHREKAEQHSQRRSIKKDLPPQQQASGWSNAREYHNFPVDSVDFYSSPTQQDGKKSTRSSPPHSQENHPHQHQYQQQQGHRQELHQHEDPYHQDHHQQQKSPYLDIRQQPPHMSPLQIGEYLFREVDRRAVGVVSHAELVNALRSNPLQAEKLRLNHRVRQADGSSDGFVAAFRDIDRGGSGDITLDEFLDFIRDNSDEYETGGHGGHRRQRFDGSTEKWETREDPVRVSTASDDILATSGNHGNRRGGDVSAVMYTSDAGGSPSRHSRYEHRSPERGDPIRESNREVQFHASTPALQSLRYDDVSRMSANAIPTTSSARNIAMSYDSSVHRRDVAGGDMPGKPPLHRVSSAGNMGTGPAVTASVDQSPAAKLGHHFPPPPTELGAEMGVILEGWLDKKSTNLGQWQKRYFVLAFGNTMMDSKNPMRGHTKHIELRIFKKCVPAVWGNVPLGFTRVIDVMSIETVETVPNKKKIDTIFKITERMRAVSGIASDIAQAPPQTDAPDRSLAADDSDDPDAAIDVVRRDSMDSVCSDAHWVDKCRVSTLRASNPEERLLWVSTIMKCQGIVTQGL